MEICKAPTLRLKALNKHTQIMYIEMENVIKKAKQKTESFLYKDERLWSIASLFVRQESVEYCESSVKQDSVEYYVVFPLDKRPSKFASLSSLEGRVLSIARKSFRSMGECNGRVLSTASLPLDGTVLSTASLPLDRTVLSTASLPLDGRVNWLLRYFRFAREYRLSDVFPVFPLTGKYRLFNVF